MAWNPLTGRYEPDAPRIGLALPAFAMGRQPQPQQPEPQPQPQAAGLLNRQQEEQPGFDIEGAMRNIYGNGGPGDPLIALGAGMLTGRNVGQGLLQGMQTIQSQQALGNQRELMNARLKAIQAKAGQPDYGYGQNAQGQTFAYDKNNPMAGINVLPGQAARPTGHWAAPEEVPQQLRNKPVWIDASGLPHVQSVTEPVDEGQKYTQEVNARRKIIDSQGGDVNDPKNQQFINTGKYPREDAQPLSASDKKAILEADEMVLANQTALKSLAQAKEASGKAWGFKGSGTAASVLAPFNQSAQDTVDLDNIVVGQALNSLKSVFGGNPTEGERAIMLQLQGSSSLPDAERQKIYDRAIDMAQKRLEFNKRRSDELRGGTYYKPQTNAVPNIGWRIEGQ